jgi:hypothetical protein
MFVLLQYGAETVFEATDSPRSCVYPKMKRYKYEQPNSLRPYKCTYLFA